MRNQSAILKRLDRIESVIGDEQAPEDNDSTLIIRRVLVEPKPVDVNSYDVPLGQKMADFGQ
jgi:hypothetical protein